MVYSQSSKCNQKRYKQMSTLQLTDNSNSKKMRTKLAEIHDEGNNGKFVRVFISSTVIQFDTIRSIFAMRVCMLK